MSTEEIKIIVNPSKRALEYTGSLILGVKGDDCAQRIYFECPKYINEFIDDMTSDNITVFIDYKNAYGEPYIQECARPVTFNDSTVTFSWIVTKFVTAKAGNVSFNVCVKKTVNGVLENEWHTTDITGRVLTKVDTTDKSPEVITHDTVTIEKLTLEVSALKSELVNAEQYIADEVSDQLTEPLKTIGNLSTAVEDIETSLTPLYVTGMDAYTVDLMQYNNWVMHWIADKSIVVNDGAGNTTIYYGPKAYSETNTFAVIEYGSSTGQMQYTLKGTCINHDAGGNKKFLVELITGDSTVNTNNITNIIPDLSKNTIITCDYTKGLYFKNTDGPFGLLGLYLYATK